MNGNELFVDTNMLIYLLKGDPAVTQILSGKQFFISFITELELLSIQENVFVKTKIKSLIQECYVASMNDAIKNITVELRTMYKIKLPDAIVSASSIYYNLPLITADKSFKKIKEVNLLLHEF